MKGKQLIFFITISSMTVCLLIVGTLFNQTAAEKVNGFFGVYDVTTEGDIAYVHYDKGVPSLYLQSDKQSLLLFSGDESENIIDITFSESADEIYFVVGLKERVENPETTVMKLDLATTNVETVFTSNEYITEIAIDPADNSYVYYIQSGSVENYSPLATKRPHKMDVHRYQLETAEHFQLTHLNAYEITSLHVIGEEEIFYIQTQDVTAETAEEIFDYPDIVYRVPFNDKRNMTAISPPTWDRDIVGMTIDPQDEGMIFSGVHNFGQGTTYEYELFSYGWDTEEYERLTDFEGNATRPIFANDKDLYFVVDQAFGSKREDYHLYKMDFSDKQYVEILLEK